MNILALVTRLALRFSTYVGKRRAVLQFFFGAVALVLGLWGWSIKAPAQDWADVLNNIFRTFQLITLHFPTSFETGVPWQLQWARLLVPLVAVSATFHILLGGVTRPLRLAMLPHTQDHVIVFGDAHMSEAALDTLVAGERQVVAVAPLYKTSRRETLEGLGLTVVEADLRQAATFRATNLSEAAALFVVGPDDLENVNRAMLAMRAVGSRAQNRPPLALAVQIDREDLATELEAALDGLTRRHGLRYHRLCPDRDGLRIELARYAPAFVKIDRSAPSHAIVLGLKGRWEQALSQLIVALQDHPTERPALTLVLAVKEREALAPWLAAHPDLDLIVRIEILDADPSGLPSDQDCEICVEADGTPHLIVILLDGSDAIAAALALRRPAHPLGAESTPILVRQSKEDFLIGALAETRIKNRDHSRMAPFSGPVRAETVARVLDRTGDEMAMALHARYLDTTKQIPPGSPEAIKAWDDLPENLREANRAAAAHMAILFASEGLSLDDGEAIKRAMEDPALMERLARTEHRRWMADRIEHGWRSGPARDNARLIHPSIKDFDSLSSEEKELDRAAVRALMEIAQAHGKIAS
jgi:hypothetical protein